MKASIVMTREWFEKYKYYLIVFSVLLSFILILPIFRDPILAINSDNYVRLAAKWKQSGTFPDSNFGPIYIVYVSFFPDGDNGVRLILLSQTVLSIMTAYFVYKIAWHYSSKRSVAGLACTLWLISPLRILFQGLVFTETLYIFLLYLGLAILINKSKIINFAVSGLVLAFAALTRGNALIIGGAVFLMLLKEVGWNKVRPYVFILAFMAPILMQSWFNYVKYNAFKPTASGDYNIAASIVGPEKNEALGLPFAGNAQVWYLPGETFPNTFVEGPIVRDRALTYAYHHPYRVFRSNLIGYVKSIAGSGDSMWSRMWGGSGKFISILGSLFRVMIYGLSLFWIGMCVFHKGSISMNWKSLFFLYGVIFVTHIIPAGAEGHSRYSVPVDPIAIIVAVFGLYHLMSARAENPEASL